MSKIHSFRKQIWHLLYLDRWLKHEHTSMIHSKPSVPQSKCTSPYKLVFYGKDARAC